MKRGWSPASGFEIASFSGFEFPELKWLYPKIEE